MRTTDDSVTINAPSHTVWEHVERLESLAQWLPVPWSLGLSGKTGAAHVGLEWKSEDLQGIDRLWTIVDAEPPRKLVVHSYVKANGRRLGILAINLEDKSGHCRLRLTVDTNSLAAGRAAMRAKYGGFGDFIFWVCVPIIIIRNPPIPSSQVATEVSYFTSCVQPFHVSGQAQKFGRGQGILESRWLYQTN